MRVAALIGLAGTAGLVLLAAGAGQVASADDSQSPYTGTAEANSLRLSVHDPQIVPFLAGGGFDATSPSAQATADSFGSGRGLASMLYPGDDLAGIAQMFGMFAPAGTPTPTLPQYPVTVTADPATPTPEDEATPVYQLSAMVKDGAAQAEANGGFPKPFNLSGLNATAKVAPTDAKGVRAVSTATASTITFGSLLKIGTVTSQAIAETGPDGTLTRESHLALTGASIAGLPLELRDGQLVVPLLGAAGGLPSCAPDLPSPPSLPSTAPSVPGLPGLSGLPSAPSLPSSLPSVLSVPGSQVCLPSGSPTDLPLATAIKQLPDLSPLKQLGFTMQVEKAQNTDTGVTAPAITITYVTSTPEIPLPVLDVPTLIPVQPGVGPTPPSTFTVEVTLGYAHAEADLTPFPSFDSGGDSGTGDASQNTTGGGAGLPDSGGGSVPPAFGGGTGDLGGGSVGGGSPLTTPVGGGTVGSVGGSSSTAGAAPVARPVAQQKGALSAFPLTARIDGVAVYLAIAAACLVALGIGILTRTQGVITRWMS